MVISNSKWTAVVEKTDMRDYSVLVYRDGIYYSETRGNLEQCAAFAAYFFTFQVVSQLLEG